MKTKKTEPYQVYEVRSFIKARNALEARRLAKKQEPHEITLIRRQTVEAHARLEDAVGYIETQPEWEEEDVPDEYCVGYKKSAK